MSQDERERIRADRERRAEAAKSARLARFAKGLSGKRVVIPDVDETTAQAARGDLGRAGFAREVGRYGGSEVTEQALRDLLAKDDPE